MRRVVRGRWPGIEARFAPPGAKFVIWLRRRGTAWSDSRRFPGWRVVGASNRAWEQPAEWRATIRAGSALRDGNMQGACVEGRNALKGEPFASKFTKIVDR
jgi:hypothetical protein